MALLSASLLLAAALHVGPEPATPAAQGTADELQWSAIWDDLAAAESSPEDAAARERLEDRWRALTAARRQGLRVKLLAARRARLGGHADARLALDLPADAPWPFDVRETWLAIPVLEPGREHTRAVLLALEQTPELAQEQVRTAWQAGVDEAQALRLRGGAVPIQEVLYARFPAPWSGVDLALTRMRLGDVEEAQACLVEALERERAAGRPFGDLWSWRGLFALGLRQEALGRDYLGRGLVLGSTDAALMLAKLDLDAGRVEAARNQLRALVLKPEPSPWALRGWGLSLLDPLKPLEPPGSMEVPESPDPRALEDDAATPSNAAD